MRKALAVLIMIGICSIYFIAMRSKGVSVGTEKAEASLKTSIEMDKQIKEITEKINENYPETPKLLMEVANEIMQVQYSKEWEPESELENQTLLALRLLYSKELLMLNSYEKQIENLRMELIKNHEDGIYLKETRIDSIKFISADNAVIMVFNETNKGTQKREYTLVKEEDLWKIYSWKDLNQEGEDTYLEE